VLPEDFYVRDNVLGWSPAKGIQVRAIKDNPTGLFHHPQGLLFDVTYTIDSNGLRIAPPYRKDDPLDTVLFFGCSFTFGEGIGDTETLPYQVGAQSGGRYRTFNFGVGAYGPEQMLAAIESGIVSRVVDANPGYAFYSALPTHVWRAAGRVAWGRNAPRYTLGADGVHLTGSLETRKPLGVRLGLNRHVSGQLNKSAIWRMLSMGESSITDDDVRLYFAIVRRSEQLLESQYPGIKFRVILWPNQDSGQLATYKKLQEGFKRMGIPVYLVEDILPGYNKDRSDFILNAVDTHPNPLANRLLAQYLLNNLPR